ncbi:MAG: tetratricopeptide repeat protein [Candidatus Wallbacteria bacterium]|nr:tetratricopeptide repeat protein [Candidatus Wallbacteria bacterium]
MSLVAGLGYSVNQAIMSVGALLAAVVLVLLLKILMTDRSIKKLEGEKSAADGGALSTGHTKAASAPKESAKPAAAAASAGKAAVAAPAAAEPPKPASPDPSMVTQYQPGTGEGIPELEEQLKQDPDNPDLLDWLAFMYYSNGKLEKAIETYQKAIALNYDNEHQHYYLGNSFYKLGNVERACEEWEVVIALKPDGKLAKNAEDRIEKCSKGQTISIEAGPRAG